MRMTLLFMGIIRKHLFRTLGEAYGHEANSIEASRCFGLAEKK